MNRIALAAVSAVVSTAVLAGCATAAPTSTARDPDRPGHSTVASDGDRPREWSTIAGVHVSTDDGYFAESAPVTDLVGIPAVDELDPALRDAVIAASAAAAADGHPFVINSGWRSKHLQRALIAKGIEDHGSAEAAAEWVASPEESAHVQGAAVDVGDVDGMTWMSENGNRFGLCQTFANELWHYELATTPGSSCPQPVADASVR